MGKNFFRVNHNIRAREVFLVDEGGQVVGNTLLQEALQKAQNVELDLVEVSPNANPPVCKILDFGKFKYEIEKQERKQKAKNKSADLKEIRLSLNIDENDLNVKIRKAREFLQKKHKVKISLMLKGREAMFADKAKEKINSFYTNMSGMAKVEVPMKRLGKSWQLTMAPDPNYSPKPKNNEKQVKDTDKQDEAIDS